MPAVGFLSSWIFSKCNRPGCMRTACVQCNYWDCYSWQLTFCTMQVWPICGDGLTLQITHTKGGEGALETLMNRAIVPDSKDKPQRQKASMMSFPHDFKASVMCCSHNCLIAPLLRALRTQQPSEIESTISRCLLPIHALCTLLLMSIKLAPWAQRRAQRSVVTANGTEQPQQTACMSGQMLEMHLWACLTLLQVEVKVPLHAGDVVDFMVHPHGNMDCDGVYIVDMQFWPDSGDTRTWES